MNSISSKKESISSKTMILFLVAILVVAGTTLYINSFFGKGITGAVIKVDYPEINREEIITQIHLDKQTVSKLENQENTKIISTLITDAATLDKKTLKYTYEQNWNKISSKLGNINPSEKLTESLASTTNQIAKETAEKCITKIIKNKNRKWDGTLEFEIHTSLKAEKAEKGYYITVLQNWENTCISEKCSVFAYTDGSSRTSEC
jgi:hypothetical protein